MRPLFYHKDPPKATEGAGSSRRPPSGRGTSGVALGRPAPALRRAAPEVGRIAAARFIRRVAAARDRLAGQGAQRAAVKIVAGGFEDETRIHPAAGPAP